jgi:hypothetical protein
MSAVVLFKNIKMNSIHDIASYDITGKGFDKNIEQMVRACHMAPLKKAEAAIEKNCGFLIKLYVSLKSSWRPVWWEKLKGRSGYSGHTYNFMGATDTTCDDFEANKEILLEYLIKETNYTRLAIYNGFIHCDYKNDYKDSWVYNSAWVRQFKIER